MSGSNSERERVMVRRIQSVIDCEGTSFADMLAAASIDPKRGLRFRNLSKLSFANQDLRGMDFTGANLVGCDFADAAIDGCHFEHARIGWLEGRDATIGNLTTSHGWEPYWKNFLLPPSREGLIFDRHLPAGAIFFDAPSLPLMMVVPNQLAQGSAAPRIAASVNPVDYTDCEKFLSDTQARDEMASEIQFVRPWALMTWRVAHAYVLWANRLGPFRYRLPFTDEAWLIDFTANVRDSISGVLVAEVDNGKANAWQIERSGFNDRQIANAHPDQGSGYHSVRLVREMA